MKQKLFSIMALFILMVASACGDTEEEKKTNTNSSETSTVKEENSSQEENTSEEKEVAETEVVPYVVTHEDTYSKVTDSGWLDGLVMEVETDTLNEEELLAIGKDVIKTYYESGDYQFFVIDINETDKPDSFTHKLMTVEQDFPNGQIGELKYEVKSDAVNQVSK
jgi:ABC-type Fe3+-hydroxamate transport system substrate-binding protein